METLIKQLPFEKGIIRNIIKEIIEDTRQNIDLKTKAINILLKTMKEENEQIISKSKKLTFY